MEVDSESNELLESFFQEDTIVPRVTILGNILQEEISIQPMLSKQIGYDKFIYNNDMSGLINFLQENSSDQQILDDIMLQSASCFNMIMTKYALELGANINANNCAIIGWIFSFPNINGSIQVFDQLLNIGLDLSLIGLKQFVDKLFDHYYDGIKYVFEHINTNNNIPSHIIDICIVYAIQHNAIRIIELLLSYDSDHALLSTDALKLLPPYFSIELLQMLLAHNKIDLQIHGPLILLSAIRNPDVLEFLLKHNIETSDIKLSDFYSNSSVSLNMLLKHGWQPSTDDITETFHHINLFIKIIAERNIDLCYASLKSGNSSASNSCFITDDRYLYRLDSDLAGNKIIEHMMYFFPTIDEYIKHNDFDGLLNHMDNVNLDQFTLDHIFIIGVTHCENKLIDHALKKVRILIHIIVNASLRY